ncbi:transglycosylase SLT domain-containing protein [Kiritimatiellota bacterium B12222]|nr:transglycosylase SLT domain-containing protein [Kiritimatiellota bacterium B12222]
MRTPLSTSRIVFTLLLCGMTAVGLWYHRIDHAMIWAGNKHQVDPLLLRAVGIQESRLNPKAKGAAGEIGMFQIMPNTAKHWARETNHPIPSEKELFRLKVNANISAWYLAEGLAEFSDKPDPLAYTLAHYNAGPTRVRKWENEVPDGIPFVETIPFPSTRRYVTRILSTYRGSQDATP